MTIPTFNPIVRPSPGSDFKPVISIRKAAFGDGYTQAAPAGLNHIRQTVSLKWDGLTEAQAASLRAFFESRKGVEPFFYRPYGIAEPVKWTCSDWSWTAQAPFSFYAKLEESFTLEE